MLTTFAVAQKVITYAPNDGSVYFKQKTNMKGVNTFEKGYSLPLASMGNFSLHANLGSTQNFNTFWTVNDWEGGATLLYRLVDHMGIYTKTSTDFDGQWKQEFGLKYRISKDSSKTVVANFGGVMNLPFKKQVTGWTAGVTVSFPIK